jgi:hypothetical protein
MSCTASTQLHHPLHGWTPLLKINDQQFMIKITVTAPSIAAHGWTVRLVSRMQGGLPVQPQSFGSCGSTS